MARMLTAVWKFVRSPDAHLAAVTLTVFAYPFALNGCS
jgi:hypothetical protein